MSNIVGGKTHIVTAEDLVAWHRLKEYDTPPRMACGSEVSDLDRWNASIPFFEANTDEKCPVCSLQVRLYPELFCK